MVGRGRPGRGFLSLIAPWKKLRACREGEGVEGGVESREQGLGQLVFCREVADERIATVI